MIVSCGEALVDLVPEPVPGGGPMNVAVAAARQGADAAFVGRVSTDAFGEQIWRHLETNGVDLRLVERGDEPTARAIVEHVPELRFRFEGEGTADTLLGKADLAVLGERPDPTIVHGGTLGLFRGQTAEVLARLAERHDGLVSLDPNIRTDIIEDRNAWDEYHERWLKHADIYKVSEEDLAWIRPNEDPEESIASMLGAGVSVVFLTLGGEGVVAFTPAGCVEIPAQPVDVVDTVGAGDTFIASALVGFLVEGYGTNEAISAIDLEALGRITERASAAAAIACSRQGADPPTSAEIDVLLNTA